MINDKLVASLAVELTQDQVFGLLTEMPIQEQTEIIIRILAGDEDCEIVNEVKRALEGWELIGD